MTAATKAAGERLVLLTGATGYVGGRLLRRLEDRGERVRCMVRRPEALEGRTSGRTDVVRGDVLRPDQVRQAMQGVDVAYYLIHSLASGSRFADLEVLAARIFADAARMAGVRRIIYLGGLGDDEQKLSEHLASRHEVGRILRNAGMPAIEFRASIIIGAGGLSFELIRSLVQRLPVMTTPKWVRTQAQPIAIADVLAYLEQGLDIELTESRVYQVGGADQVSYRELMLEYARQRGLRRLLIPVPVLSPGLSSLWLHLVTPIYAPVGRKLIDSCKYPSVVREASALEDFDIEPMGIADAIRAAREEEDRAAAETHWADAFSSTQRPALRTRYGTRRIDVRQRVVQAPADATFATIQRIGGPNGWYFGDALWRLRGALDLLVGGPGFRRGRRDTVALRVGDVVDFWRVEAFDPGERLRLVAEMRLPGRAWLEFRIVDRQPDQCTLQQTAEFDPRGLLGIAYWYSLVPLHHLVFGGMLRAIARRAEERPPSGRPEEATP
jgi:uncharacterized protein YbjT (DUF2867 family)